MKKMLLTLLTCILLVLAGWAQQAQGKLDIQLNRNVLQPGDSLLVSVDYKEAGPNPAQPMATLELIVENEQGQRTRLRWPVINGHASGTLFLPDSLPRGRYQLLAAFQQRFFEVVGKITDPDNNRSILAMILTKNGNWDQQEVPVGSDGSFAIRNWLFEDNALLAFSSTKNNNQPLNIRISTQLDSSNAPIAVAGRSFYIGSPSSAVLQTLNQPVETAEAAFADPGNLLPAVLVRTTTKSPAQQFNEKYVRGLFQSVDERMISIMDDPSALAMPNIFSYLQGRVAGLQISPNGFNGGSARWRGGPVTFFIDEIRTSAQQVASIPMTDIAIVKAYPPPFMGAPGGGGGIAIYTRRGGEANYLPPNRQVFKVRGYTPGVTALNMNKLSM